MKEKFKIVIADRNRNVCDLLQRELEQEGYDVRAANNGKELMNLLGSGELPELLVIDPDLPLINADEVIELLKMFATPPAMVIHSFQSDISGLVFAGGQVAFVEKRADLGPLKKVIAEELKKQSGIKGDRILTGEHIKDHG